MLQSHPAELQAQSGGYGKATAVSRARVQMAFKESAWCPMQTCQCSRFRSKRSVLASVQAPCLTYSQGSHTKHRHTACLLAHPGARGTPPVWPSAC